MSYPMLTGEFPARCQCCHGIFGSAPLPLLLQAQLQPVPSEARTQLPWRSGRSHAALLLHSQLLDMRHHTTRQGMPKQLLGPPCCGFRATHFRVCSLRRQRSCCGHQSVSLGLLPDKHVVMCCSEVLPAPALSHAAMPLLCPQRCRQQKQLHCRHLSAQHARLQAAPQASPAGRGTGS